MRKYSQFVCSLVRTIDAFTNDFDIYIVRQKKG